MDKIEPRPKEEIFPGGLDPPDSLLRKQRHEPKEAAILWRALELARQASHTIFSDPRALLAWANQNNDAKKRSFLI